MKASRPTGFSIEVFLIDGDPKGTRTVRRPGWTGACLAFARSDFASAISRPELARSGVYILMGPSDGSPASEHAYIGEGESIVGRMRQHHKNRDFWTRAIALTSSDDWLNKAHVRYLEASLIALARTAGVASLENSQLPEVPGLLESERATLDAFVHDALPLLAIAGYDIFRSAETPKPAQIHSSEEGFDRELGPLLLRLSAPDADATGAEDPAGFVVFEGSLCRIQPTASFPESARASREALVENGVLVVENESQYRFTRNYRFGSPSTAASIVCAGSKNGRTMWRSDDGQTLAEIQQRQAE